MRWRNFWKIKFLYEGGFMWHCFLWLHRVAGARKMMFRFWENIRSLKEVVILLFPRARQWCVLGERGTGAIIPQLPVGCSGKVGNCGASEGSGEVVWCLELPSSQVEEALSRLAWPGKGKGLCWRTPELLPSQWLREELSEPAASSAHAEHRGRWGVEGVTEPC